MSKRISLRGIVYFNNELVVMYRERADRTYYTFPGGGLEDKETHEECLIRELKEEFGIKVKPLKFKYYYETEKNIEYFYLCEYVSGKFGSGEGEEFDKNNPGGKYVPMTLKLEDIKKYNLLPPEVKEQLILDLNTNGKNLGDLTHKIYAHQ